MTSHEYELLVWLVGLAIWLAGSMAAWWLAVRLSIRRWENFTWPLLGVLILAVASPFIFHWLATFDQPRWQWAAFVCWPAVPLVMLAWHLAVRLKPQLPRRDADARTDPMTLGTLASAQAAVTSSVMSIVFTLSVWCVVFTRPQGTFDREGGMLLTFFVLPFVFAVWVGCACFAVAFLFASLGSQKHEALSIPDAARVKTLRSFACVWLLGGFVLATVGDLVVMAVVCRP